MNWSIDSFMLGTLFGLALNVLWISLRANRLVRFWPLFRFVDRCVCHILSRGRSSAFACQFFEKIGNDECDGDSFAIQSVSMEQAVLDGFSLTEMRRPDILIVERFRSIDGAYMQLQKVKERGQL